MFRILLGLLGLLVMLVVSVATSATTFAAMPAVTDSVGNVISNHLEILALKTSSSVLKSSIAGVKIEMVCEHEHVSGWLLERGAYFLGYWSAHYLRCTMPKPAAGNCKIHNELFQLEAHALILLGAGGPGTFEEGFTPEENPYFTLLTIEGCTNTALNGTYEYTGSIVAEVNNSTLELSWTESSSNLKFGGNEAKYIDNIKPEMLGGGGLMVENEG